MAEVLAEGEGGSNGKQRRETLRTSYNPRPAVHLMNLLLIFLQDKDPNWNAAGAAPQIQIKKWSLVAPSWSVVDTMICHPDCPSRRDLPELLAVLSSDSLYLAVFS